MTPLKSDFNGGLWSNIFPFGASTLALRIFGPDKSDGLLIWLSLLRNGTETKLQYMEATVKHNNNDSIVSFSSYFITYITVHSALVCSKTIKALLKNESSSQTCTHSTLMNDPSLHRMATHSTLSTLFTSWKIVIIKFVFYAQKRSFIYLKQQTTS